MTVAVPGEVPRAGVFLCLVSNVSPWTYLGARPINPSPKASFDTALDVFALSRMGPVRMLNTLRQAMSPEPAARGRRVHHWHDRAEITLTAKTAAGDDIKTISLTGAWPSAHTLSSMDSNSNEQAYETLTFTYDTMAIS